MRVWASWLGDTAESGANAYETINRTNHWAAFLSFSIMIAILTAIRTMKPHPNRFMQKIRGAVMIVALCMSFIYFIYDFYEPISDKIDMIIKFFKWLL